MIEIEAPEKEPRLEHEPAARRVERRSACRSVRRPARARCAALDGLTLAVAAGEVLGIVGPSGCGKSTLLELICGLESRRGSPVGGRRRPARRLDAAR